LPPRSCKGFFLQPDFWRKTMWKLIVGFIIFAGIALFVLMRAGGDIDMGGEKHGMDHAPEVKATASAPAAPEPAPAPAPVPAAAASDAAPVAVPAASAAK
jgi:hypothetical protein